MIGRTQPRAMIGYGVALGAISFGALCSSPLSAAPVCTPTAVVEADALALSSGDPNRILGVFNEDAQVFELPKDPASLTGPLSAKLGTQEQRRSTFTAFAGEKPDRTEVVDSAEVGDLAVAKLRITNSRTGAVTFFLAGYRVANCRIAALWHIGNSDSDDGAEQTGRSVLGMVAANNAGLLDSFLGSFDPAVLHFRSSGDPMRIGDKLSKWNGDPEGRRQLYAAMFAKGAPAQVQAHVFAVGDLVVSRDVAQRPDGATIDEISIYRVANHRITHDWLIAEQPRSR